MGCGSSTGRERGSSYDAADRTVRGEGPHSPSPQHSPRSGRSASDSPTQPPAAVPDSEESDRSAATCEYRLSVDSGMQRHSLNSWTNGSSMTPGNGSFGRFSGESPASRLSHGMNTSTSRSPLIPGFIDENMSLESAPGTHVSGGMSMEEPQHPLWWQHTNFVAPSTQQEIVAHRAPQNVNKSEWELGVEKPN